MLIYDYMPNKSLDLSLFDESKRAELTWERRLSIIEGIAQGLLYLHKYSRLRVIHRDLKAANILLDQNMNPNISDFGLAKIFMQNLSEENTSRVVGTHGYMAPEYAMEGIFSVKSDVYSFGVLILEILSDRKNKSCFDVEVPYNIVALVWELWNTNAAFELIDPSLTIKDNETITARVEIKSWVRPWYHNGKENDISMDTSHLKPKYDLLVFSPSGFVIQYAFPMSSGLGGVAGVSGISTTYDSSHECDARLVVKQSKVEYMSEAE